MALRLGNAARTASADAAANLLNTGTIEIRTGGQPTNVGDADTGTLLATLTFAATAFGAASDGVKTANAIGSDDDASESGEAAHARLKTSASAIHSDCTVGEAADSPDVEFDNKMIVKGGVVSISSATWTQPI